MAELIKRSDYARKWEPIRDKIKKDIMEKGWNEKVKAFTQVYGSEDLDASTLLLESNGLIEANDPRYIITVKATQRELSRNGLMYRYKKSDDFGVPTSSFTICTFWLIQAVDKIGEHNQAKELFDQILSYSIIFIQRRP